MDFRGESLEDLAARVRSGEVGARELAGHALERVAALDGRLNAFVALDPDAALAAAADVDERVARGEDPGPLAGVPLAVKDLEDATGFLTTHGSAAFAGDPPAREDSVLVRRLKAAGCVVLGKTNTPELGWMGDTVNNTFGATRNPWNLDHSPGGSSGGSAAAVAAGMVPLATGSDGGGSIRIPSACCGLSGHKPSLGRVPSGGAHPPDWVDLSTKGVIARSVRDVAYALDVVVGPEPTDLRSLPAPGRSWRTALDGVSPPARVAWSPTLGYATVDPEVTAACEAAVRHFEEAGSVVEEVDAVFDEDPVGLWLALSASYNLRTLAAFRDSPVWEKVDPLLRMTLEWAASQSPLDLVAAEDACHHLNVRLASLFERFDVLCTPVTAGLAPRSGELPEILGVADPNWVRFTYPFNMTRSPAGTVCAGFASGSGVPIGLQVVGSQHDDVGVLRALAFLEDDLGLADRLAPV